MYKIVRMFHNSYRHVTIARNMTREEVKAWCRDPETSSSTCTSALEYQWL